MSLSELKTKAEILLSKFYKGDDTAFSELYDMYVQVLFNYGIRLTSDQELLKDCIHDVFIKVYAKRSENSPINNLSSYLPNLLIHPNVLNNHDHHRPLPIHICKI